MTIWKHTLQIDTGHAMVPSNSFKINKTKHFNTFFFSQLFNSRQTKTLKSSINFPPLLKTISPKRTPLTSQSQPLHSKKQAPDFKKRLSFNTKDFASPLFCELLDTKAKLEEGFKSKSFTFSQARRYKPFKEPSAIGNSKTTSTIEENELVISIKQADLRLKEKRSCKMTLNRSIKGSQGLNTKS